MYLLNLYYRYYIVFLILLKWDRLSCYKLFANFISCKYIKSLVWNIYELKTKI